MVDEGNRRTTGSSTSRVPSAQGQAEIAGSDSSARKRGGEVDETAMLER
jgi:hypothetical protein